MRAIPRKLKDSDADARAYALKLLGYRGRSRREMLDSLRRKGFDDEQINRTIEYLAEIGLMNDEALASDLYRLSADYKSLGKKGIRTFLIKRGLDKDLIENTLSAHTSEIEEKTALEFAEKRLETLKPHPRRSIRRTK